MKTKKTDTLAVKLVDSLLEDENKNLTSEETKTFNLPKKGAAENTSPASGLDEKTLDLGAPNTTPSVSSDHEPTVRYNRNGAEVVGPRLVRPQGQSANESAVMQSESLRVAQARIVELEKEVDKLRLENFELSQAGQLLQRKADEMISRVEQAEKKYSESQKILNEEKAIYRSNLSSREKENKELRKKVEQLESRLESDFKKIRVRERELEHRLELVKLEHASVVRTKDENVLELRRKMDQLQMETENYRAKGQDLYKKLADSEETMRRVVRALRIALSIVEGTTPEDDEDKVEE